MMMKGKIEIEMDMDNCSLNGAERVVLEAEIRQAIVKRGIKITKFQMYD